MKSFLARFMIVIIALVLIPWVVVYYISQNNCTLPKSDIVSIYDTKTNKVFETGLEDYLVGVVAAEMPVSFEEEALKAQAVAARTYALTKIDKNISEHSGADLCNDHGHCQAHIDKEAMIAKWGNDYENNLLKIKKAVCDTSGEIICYNGETAITVFHSCSNGKTENSHDVWSGSYPYLVSVQSPGENEKSDYVTRVSITKADFEKKLKEINNTIKIDSDNIEIDDFTMTEGQNVYTLKIGDNTVFAKDIRKALSLKSTAFTVQISGDDVVFEVYGNGHGVGMSQYGANAMAKEGKNYREILMHYYKGVSIKNLNI